MILPLMVLLMALLLSCDDNNGDIGNLYGRWRLDCVDIDGVEQTEWKGDDNGFCSWSFQGGVICIEVSHIDHVVISQPSYGTWERGEGTLTVNFTHSDNQDHEGEGPYEAPGQICFPPGVTTFELIEDTSDRLVLTTMLDDGRRLTYSLSKISL